MNRIVVLARRFGAIALSVVFALAAIEVAAAISEGSSAGAHAVAAVRG